MLKSFRNRLSFDLTTIILFLLVSISYPNTYKFIVPSYIFLAFYKLYQVVVEKECIKRLTHNFLYLLVFSLIFFRTIHTITLVFCIVCSGYLFFTTKDKNNNISLKTEILVFLFFLLILFNLVIFKPYLKSIDTYLYLMFYPLLFFFLKKVSFKINSKKILKFFILSVFIASIELFILNLIYGDLQFQKDTFFADYLGLTHVYFGMFLGVSCSFIFILLDAEKKRRKKYILSLIFLLILLIHIGARMALLGVITIIGVFILKKTKEFSKTNKTILIITSLCFLFFTFKSLPRVKDDIVHVNKVYISVKNNDKNDLILNSWRNIYKRFLITKYTIDEISENLYLGIGLQNVRDTLGYKIRKDGFKYFEFMNPHNQYLHIFLAMGIYCFTYFILMLFYFLKKQYNHSYFLIFFLILMLSESLLVRVKGISVFFLFSILLSKKNILLND